MSTFLVAGGAGFIGSHVCERLLNQGSKVICVDNLITGSETNLEKLYENENFVFLRQDVSDGITGLNSSIDGIFHLASPASPNSKSPKSYIAHPIETMMVNSIGTKNLLDIAREKNASFLYASSSEVYGDPHVSPQNEEYFGNVNPNGVRSVYDEGKRFGEAIAMAYHRKFGVDTKIIRIFNTYGDRMQKDDGRVVSNFINQALQNQDITVYGSGKQTRSFCFVDDLVDGLLAAIESKEATGEVINLGNPDEHKIVDLASKIKELVGGDSSIVHEELPEDDPHQRKPDISKAEKILGFKPKVGLNEGLEKTIEYFSTI